MPNLVGAAVTGDPAVFAREAVQASEGADELVIVGHSAAGPLLPVVAGAIGRVHRMVFVDATLPACEGPAHVGGEFLAALQALATNGVLPVWSKWWGEGVLDFLVRDDGRRREIEMELPTVPLAFFETPIAPPAGWCAGDGAFVLLSEFYRSDADRAAALGWPVVEHLGAHLDMANDEEGIATVLEDLAA